MLTYNTINNVTKEQINAICEINGIKLMLTYNTINKVTKEQINATCEINDIVDMLIYDKINEVTQEQCEYNMRNQWYSTYVYMQEHKWSY